MLRFWEEGRFIFVFITNLNFVELFQSIISYLVQTGLPTRKLQGKRREEKANFSPFLFCFTSVVISRVDLSGISDWHLADLNPSCLNLCSAAALGIYPRADTNLGGLLQNSESGMRN